MKKVMVFGVFDGLHAGHAALFNQAKDFGDHLIAVVTPDLVVHQLKNRPPKNLLAARLAAVESAVNVDVAAPGDEELGTWAVVHKFRPDVVALGYDQTALAEDLENHLADFKWPLAIEVLAAFEPDTHHSSLIKN